MFKNSIISEDAKFLSTLQLSLFNYNDDLTTVQMIFRRHINEIVRILLSLKNFNNDLLPRDQQSTLLLDGIGYFWTSDSNKLLEMSCYQSILQEVSEPIVCHDEIKLQPTCCPIWQMRCML